MIKKERSKTAGFTLIELLVVIAIIGVLSSVVLASLNSARGKGNDSKVKAQLSSARAAAEIYYGNNGGYGTAANCTAGMFVEPISGMVQYTTAGNYPTGVTLVCGASPTAYMMAGSLPFETGYWCVDSLGASKRVTVGVPANGQTACPAS